jgi:hypothetical protein
VPASLFSRRSRYTKGLDTSPSCRQVSLILISRGEDGVSFIVDTSADIKIPADIPTRGRVKNGV